MSSSMAQWIDMSLGLPRSLAGSVSISRSLPSRSSYRQLLVSTHSSSHIQCVFGSFLEYEAGVHHQIGTATHEVIRRCFVRKQALMVSTEDEMRDLVVLASAKSNSTAF